MSIIPNAAEAAIITDTPMFTKWNTDRITVLCAKRTNTTDQKGKQAKFRHLTKISFLPECGSIQSVLRWIWFDTKPLTTAVEQNRSGGECKAAFYLFSSFYFLHFQISWVCMMRTKRDTQSIAIDHAAVQKFPSQLPVRRSCYHKSENITYTISYHTTSIHACFQLRSDTNRVYWDRSGRCRGGNRSNCFMHVMEMVPHDQLRVNVQ